MRGMRRLSAWLFVGFPMYSSSNGGAEGGAEGGRANLPGDYGSARQDEARLRSDFFFFFSPSTSSRHEMELN